jgi:hypothetical protein
MHMFTVNRNAGAAPPRCGLMHCIHSRALWLLWDVGAGGASRLPLHAPSADPILQFVGFCFLGRDGREQALPYPPFSPAGDSDGGGRGQP